MQWERHLQGQVLVGQAELLGSTEELPGGTARCSLASEGPPELHLLSCCGWHLLKAPQGLGFIWFWVGFFSFNSRVDFHAGYQLSVACCCLQPGCGCFLPIVYLVFLLLHSRLKVFLLNFLKWLPIPHFVSVLCVSHSSLPALFPPVLLNPLCCSSFCFLIPSPPLLSLVLLLCSALHLTHSPAAFALRAACPDK